MRKLSTTQVCEMARALDGATEKDHFGGDAFVANGRIFATVWHDKNTVNLMLNLEQQKYFLSIDGEGFNQINNAWGRQGATNVQLEFVDPDQLSEALKAAWENSAKKRPAFARKAKTSDTKKTTAKKSVAKSAAAEKKKVPKKGPAKKKKA
jgi:hypothetical protein